MQVLVAVMWFLSLLIPGQNYEIHHLDQIVVENESAIVSVLQDDVLWSHAKTNYDNNNPDDNGVGLPRDWEAPMEDQWGERYFEWDEDISDPNAPKEETEEKPKEEEGDGK